MVLRRSAIEGEFPVVVLGGWVTREAIGRAWPGIGKLPDGVASIVSDVPRR